MRPEKKAAKNTMNIARALKVAQRMAENAPARLTPAPRERVDVPRMAS